LREKRLQEGKRGRDSEEDVMLVETTENSDAHEEEKKKRLS